ncbi:MAG: G5 domain-containing protein [Candidatus Ancillula sp.]|jgi:hypothetical protein|nr:G5 domain-containing protein [Candidatus Ancillula sp.]
MDEPKTESNKTADLNVLTIICLIVLFPLGIYRVFRYHASWLKNARYIILLVIAGLFWTALFVSALNGTGGKSPETPTTENVKTDTRVVTEKEHIAFKEEKVDDPSLAKGEEKIEREGIDGEKIITYEVKSENGHEVSKTKVKEEVTKEPITKLVKVGTYVAPAPVETEPQQSAVQPQPTNSGNGNSTSNNSGTTTSGYCKDGTPASGDPSASGKANVCYGHGGWVK